MLLYRIYTRADGLEGIKWCQYQYNKVDQRPGDNDIRTIMTTPLEFKLLQELLTMNAKLLPLGYKPRKDLYEEKFRVSVLLPVGPLTFEALGSLNNDTGCVICGKERTSRCSQCQSVSYCGASEYFFTMRTSELTNLVPQVVRRRTGPLTRQTVAR